ncbi:MAG: zinc ribbon domain-containing protein [Ruminococcaceae bacterium]|nr:zinc ribbon domain-containing protein [Oscillospiraceae bacterium]
MANFCTNCGAPMGEADVFCLACGTQKKVVPVQPEVPPVQQPPAYMPPPPPGPPPMMGPPVRPGRGQGIASMVLGIVSLVWSFYLYYSAYVVLYIENEARSSGSISVRSVVGETMAEIFAPCFVVVFLLAILSVVFGAISKAKGFYGGAATAGLSTAFPSIGFIIVTLIMLVA